jgi:hypothetical protein
MKVCFLLGSGVSRPASFPSLEEIGARVLSSENIVKGTDGIYREKRSSDGDTFFSDEELKRLLEFLRWLELQANIRFERTPHRANYEDLFYLATQIHDDILDEYENPAVQPFIREALANLGDFIPEGARPLDHLSELAGNATRYIRDVVAVMLTKPPEWTDYLKLFLDGAHDSTVSEVNLFTLNHDKLLEEYFAAKIDVTDGFEEQDSLGIRRWNPTLFDVTPRRGIVALGLLKLHGYRLLRWCCSRSGGIATVRLFKLHGSVDWLAFRPEQRRQGEDDSNAWTEEYIGIRSSSSLSSARDSLGRRHEAVRRPLVSIGTFNKMIDYTDRVFFEMHYRLIRTLDEAERLIICGYGFGDKGVNKRITEWMCSSLTRKILVIDPKEPEKLKESARSAIALKIDAWKQEKRWVHWVKGLGAPEITWDQIAKEFLEGRV